MDCSSCEASNEGRPENVPKTLGNQKVFTFLILVSWSGKTTSRGRCLSDTSCVSVIMWGIRLSAFGLLAAIVQHTTKRKHPGKTKAAPPQAVTRTHTQTPRRTHRKKSITSVREYPGNKHASPRTRERVLRSLCPHFSQ